MRTNYLAPITLTAVFVLSSGCENKNEETAAASLSAAPTPPPAAPPEPEPEVVEEEPSRPTNIETELTDTRRTKVETEMGDAKGFITANSIEEKLKADKKIDQKESAVKAFDRAAKGKWVLFTGPLANPTQEGFDLGITYTPQLPEDRMGMSRQWFPITFTEIEGYEEGKFKPGQVVVVLAKYDGEQKASKGAELVEKGYW